jgi:hypothetical protein
MPSLSNFYGITIYMYWDEHPPPHFHAKAEGDWVSIEIRTLKVTGGALSPKHMALVLKWASLHQSELMEAWNLCSAQIPPPRITPLP